MRCKIQGVNNPTWTHPVTLPTLACLGEMSQLSLGENMPAAAPMKHTKHKTFTEKQADNSPPPHTQPSAGLRWSRLCTGPAPHSSRLCCKQSHHMLSLKEGKGVWEGGSDGLCSVQYGIYVPWKAHKCNATPQKFHQQCSLSATPTIFSPSGKPQDF